MGVPVTHELRNLPPRLAADVDAQDVHARLGDTVVLHRPHSRSDEYECDDAGRDQHCELDPLHPIQ